MNAKTARKITNAAPNDNEIQLRLIFSAIEEAASVGRSRIDWIRLSDYVWVELEKLGYTVKKTERQVMGPVEYYAIIW